MINLLPPTRLLNMRIARANTNIRRYIELIAMSIIVLVLAVVAAFYFLNSQQSNAKAAADLHAAQVAELEPVQKQAEDLSATINTISRLLSQNVKFSEMLTQIGGLMPTGSILTGLQFSIEDLEAPLVVSAEVDSEEKAAILRNNLESSDLFERASLVSIVQIEEDESSTPAPTEEGAPASSQPVLTNPYKFTTTINVYLKKIEGAN